MWVPVSLNFGLSHSEFTLSVSSTNTYRANVKKYTHTFKLNFKMLLCRWIPEIFTSLQLLNQNNCHMYHMSKSLSDDKENHTSNTTINNHKLQHFIHHKRANWPLTINVPPIFPMKPLGTYTFIRYISLSFQDSSIHHSDHFRVAVNYLRSNVVIHYLQICPNELLPTKSMTAAEIEWGYTSYDPREIMNRYALIM